MKAEVVSSIVIAGSAAVIILLERRFPYNESQRFVRGGFWTDLAFYSLVQNYVLGLIIVQLIQSVRTLTGWNHPPLIVSSLHPAIQLLLFLFSHDLYIYWFHRLQHYSPLLWRIHEAHHSAEDVDWLS